MLTRASPRGAVLLKTLEVPYMTESRNILYSNSDRVLQNEIARAILLERFATFSDQARHFAREESQLPADELSADLDAAGRGMVHHSLESCKRRKQGQDDLAAYHLNQWEHFDYRYRKLSSEFQARRGTQKGTMRGRGTVYQLEGLPERYFDLELWVEDSSQYRYRILDAVVHEERAAFSCGAQAWRDLATWIGLHDRVGRGGARTTVDPVWRSSEGKWKLRSNIHNDQPNLIHALHCIGLNVRLSADGPASKARVDFAFDDFERDLLDDV